MANPKRGEVSILLDRQRTLAFTLGGLIGFKREHGKEFDEHLIDLGNTFRACRGKLIPWTEIAPRIAESLRAGLLHEDKDLTIEAAMDLVEQAEGDGIAQKFHYVLAKLNECWLLWTLGEVGKKKMAKMGKKELEELERQLQELPVSIGTGSNGSDSATSASIPETSGALPSGS